MTALAIIAVACVVMLLISGGIIAWVWRKAEVAEANRYRADTEAHNAAVQEKYTQIGTDGRSVDDTGRVLDDGKFFVPPAEVVQLGRAEGRGGRTEGGA